MKKFFRIITIISILLLINSSSFAEPLKKEINDRLFNKEEVALKGSLILSVEKAQDLFLGFFFTENKGNLDMLLTETKDIIRFRINNNLILINNTGKVISRLFEKIKEDSALITGFVDDFILIKYNWDGKDRIISLDYGEEDSSDIFLRG